MLKQYGKRLELRTQVEQGLDVTEVTHGLVSGRTQAWEQGVDVTEMTHGLVSCRTQA